MALILSNRTLSLTFWAKTFLWQIPLWMINVECFLRLMSSAGSLKRERILKNYFPLNCRLNYCSKSETSSSDERTSCSLSSSEASSGQRSSGSCWPENQTMSYLPSTTSHPSRGSWSMKGWSATEHILATNADRLRWLSSSGLHGGRQLAWIPLSKGFFYVADGPKAFSNDFHLAELMLLSEGNQYKVHVNCSREDTVASVTSGSARPANAFSKIRLLSTSVNGLLFPALTNDEV